MQKLCYIGICGLILCKFINYIVEIKLTQHSRSLLRRVSMIRRCWPLVDRKCFFLRASLEKEHSPSQFQSSCKGGCETLCRRSEMSALG